jgi:aspartate carbamoyltransferase regulatory subunit
LNKKIRLTPINNGIALDHLKAGTALKILNVINTEGITSTVAINVESKKMNKKDILFFEGKKLEEQEKNKIALIGAGGTLNIIENSKVITKQKITYPNYVEEVIQCINPKCITNHEGIKTKFLISENPLKATCKYCETEMNEAEIIRGIKK